MAGGLYVALVKVRLALTLGTPPPLLDGFKFGGTGLFEPDDISGPLSVIVGCPSPGLSPSPAEGFCPACWLGPGV